ncbi:MAG: glycoside hydrolase family 3 N-terminal domain-containing protein, partial [Pseudomonadota bacterium]
RVIEGVIRGHMGFDGVLVSDDLGMNALKGDFRSRAEASLRAGCDVVLHCGDDGGEMRLVAEGAATLAPAALRRVAAAEARRRQGIEPFETAGARARLDILLA